MTKINDGGPAFPRPYSSTGDGMSVYSQSGMTLRDWFAGQALTGLLTIDHPLSVTIDGLASESYQYADAMLSARASEASHD